MEANHLLVQFTQKWPVITFILLSFIKTLMNARYLIISIIIIENVLFHLQPYKYVQSSNGQWMSP